MRQRELEWKGVVARPEGFDEGVADSSKIDELLLGLMLGTIIAAAGIETNLLLAFEFDLQVLSSQWCSHT